MLDLYQQLSDELYTLSTDPKGRHYIRHMRKFQGLLPHNTDIYLEFYQDKITEETMNRLTQYLKQKYPFIKVAYSSFAMIIYFNKDGI